VNKKDSFTNLPDSLGVMKKSLGRSGTSGTCPTNCRKAYIRRDTSARARFFPETGSGCGILRRRVELLTGRALDV
jgi:hypothetical protein